MICFIVSEREEKNDKGTPVMRKKSREGSKEIYDLNRKHNTTFESNFRVWIKKENNTQNSQSSL